MNITKSRPLNETFDDVTGSVLKELISDESELELESKTEVEVTSSSATADVDIDIGD